MHKRPKTTSVSSAVSSDTDGEEYNWTNDKSILESNAALIEAKLKRKEDEIEKQEQEEAMKKAEKAKQDEIEKQEQEEAIRRAVEEQMEREAKEQEEKDRIKAEEENKRKIAAEKRKAELEAKKKAAEEKKKLEEEEKKKAIEEKRKKDAEAKKKAMEEKKRVEEEKKKQEEEEKLKAEEEKKKKAAAVTKKLAEKKAAAKKLEDEKKQAEEEKKRLEEKKKEESAAKQKAMAEKKLADIEAKKASEEAEKQAEEDRIKAEEELKEKQAQEEKYARLEKIEAEKQRAWEEQKLEDEKKKKANDERRKQEAEESQRKPKVSETLVDDDMDLEEQENLETEIPKKTAKKGSRSASADKRKKAADLVKDGNTKQEESGDFIDDSEHRIDTKEDLFAAIGNTTLTAGKRSKQKSRRQTAEVSKEEIKAASNYAEEKMDDAIISKENNRIGQKSRTSSGERPSSKLQQDEDEEMMEMTTEDVVNLTTSRKTQKSRTASRERPSSKLQYNENEGAYDLNTEEEMNQAASRKAQKSRTASRERPSDLPIQSRTPSRPSSRMHQNEYEEEIDVEKETPVKQATTSKGQKSRTSSRERPTDLPIQSRSSSRPSSRMAKNETEDAFIMEQEESVVQAATPTGRSMKSRTSSRERPKDLPINESGVSSSRERIASRSDYDDPYINLQDTTMDEEAVFKQSVAESKPIRSRTTSRSKPSKQDRPSSRQGSDIAQEEIEEEMIQSYSNRARFAASRTSSSEDDTVHPRPSYPGKAHKSRTASGERQKGRDQDVSSVPKLGLGLEERPKSSASNKSYGKAKSRTVSRERPNDSLALVTDAQRRRSRTSSNEQAQQANREDILDPQEVAYEMMKKDHHPRGFRDEAAMDLEEHEAADAQHRPYYDRNLVDEEEMDEYTNRYRPYNESDMLTEDDDEGPPPTEPIFDYNGAEITNGLGQSYNLRTGQQQGLEDPGYDISRQENYNSYLPDNEQYAAEMEHSEDELGNRVTRTKKVSFAAEDEQFNLKPEPEVKTIPGSGMFCFAPSSTHEQPKDVVDGSKVSKTQNVTKTAPKGKKGGSKDDPSLKDQTENDEPSVPSTSPKTFLKQMISIDKGKNRSRDSSKEGNRRGDSRERSNSILDKILKRENSQGSQASSRQESMERGGSESGVNYISGENYKSTDISATESEDNAVTGTASDPGKSAFFSRIGKKNKKKLEIKPTDFDELFARGHALGAQLEGAQPGQNGFGAHSPSSPGSSSQPPTPFAMFSQEEAFKQTQKQAGLTYEEKVQSFLDDQQHVAPFMQQKPMDFEDVGTIPTEKSKSAAEKQHRSRSRKKQNEQEQGATTQPTAKRTPSYSRPENVSLATADNEDVMSSASLPASSAGGGVCTGGSNMAVSSYNRLRMARTDPSGEDINKQERTRSASTASRKKKEMTPEQFLKSLGDFVKKAEVDQQYAQPVWPAVVQSPNDLPPRREMAPGQEPNRNFLFENTARTSPRPISPVPKGLKPASTSPYGAAADLRPSDIEEPFNQVNSSYLQQQPQSNASSNYQQSRSLMPGEESTMQRIAPSPGKSYLDQPSSLSPDPFQSRIEEQTSIDGTGHLPPLPSSNSAMETSSSILADLVQPAPSPRRPRSPNQMAKGGERIAPGDSHIPMQLAPDPLTAHELQTPQQLRIALPDENKLASKTQSYSQPSIRDTDLYRKLQEGLSSMEKLMQSETFKSELGRSGVDYRKYSHHLGRAEFGTLKKRSSLGNLDSFQGPTGITFDKPDGGPLMDGKLGNVSSQQSASATQLMGRTRFGGGAAGSESSREPSKERPGSSLGFTRTGSGAMPFGDTRSSNMPGQGTGKRTSKQSSRDSSIGRPDSRLSDNIPDLETEEQPLNNFGGTSVRRTGSSSSRGVGGDTFRKPLRMDDQEEEERRLQEQLDIKPHPEVYEKRQEVLQEMAAQKQNIKEAKGRL